MTAADLKPDLLVVNKKGRQARISWIGTRTDWVAYRFVAPAKPKHSFHQPRTITRGMKVADFIAAFEVAP